MEKVYESDGEEVRVVVQEFVDAYLQAVYCKAMQSLNNRYRGTDLKKYAEPRAEMMEGAADNYEQDYRMAIYKLVFIRN